MSSPSGGEASSGDSAPLPVDGARAHTIASPTDVHNFGTLFELLPLGAYRSLPDGRQIRANAALVRLNGYDNEPQMVAAVRDIASEWYVLPQRCAEFQTLLERNGRVSNFVSEIHRHRTRERIWVSENAHVVRNAQGQVLYYEGTVEDITERVRAQDALHRNEEHLRHIANHVPGMLFRVHFNQQSSAYYSFVSEGVRDIYGLAPADVLDKPSLIRSYRHPEDMLRVDQAMAQAVGQRLPLSVEYRIVLDGGTTKWVHLSSSAALSETNENVRVGLITDVSAQHQAKAALQESEARWKLALDTTGDGVWDWNIETGVEVLSQRGRQMYGLDGEDWLDRMESLDARTHPDDVPQMLLDRQAHFDGRATMYVNEHRIQCQDGSWKWVLSRGMIIARNAQGQPTRMIGTHTDITLRKQAEALRSERDRAEAAQQAMTAFLSRVSHELRTPLNAILGFSQLIDTDPLTPGHQAPWIKNVLTSGQHLLALVDDILDLSGVQSGHVALLMSNVVLRDAMQECVTMLAASAQAAEVSVVVTLTDRADLPLPTDRKRLKQVLSNLLSNAIKYNRRQGTVHVRIAKEAGTVRFEFQDSGRGLSPEQVARLFTPFDRLGAQFSDIAGAGLGLALSRQLALALGGDIQASSELGVGSTFTLRLPCAGPPGHRPANGSGMGPSAGASDGPSPGSSAART